MILDSSAILAVVLKEPGHERLVEKLGAAPQAGVGTPTLVETGIVLTVKVGGAASRILALFVAESELIVIPFGEAHWRAAVNAFERYGKGRNRAGLNFGDCLSYATAKLAEQPLLCTGADFSKTDLTLA